MKTRFAPSPTGLLHLGHAYSALIAWQAMKKAGGTFLLRIEDIDFARCKPEYEAAIFEDLRWLGLDWPLPVMRQSERGHSYNDALAKLDVLGLTYACRCTRRDIERALSAPQEGDQTMGPDGPIYPGTCRHRNHSAENSALRLNMRRAIEHLGPQNLSDMVFKETGQTHEGVHQLSAKMLLEDIGDIVIARKDIGASYHLCVVVDDAAQDISLVPRGEDMFAATYVHRLLQALLGLPTPTYLHHRLIRDDTGKRLAKRDDARSIANFRASGLSAETLISRVMSGDRV